MRVEGALWRDPGAALCCGGARQQGHEAGAKDIFQAAKQGDKKTMSRLLPDATTEELNYTEKVCIVQFCHHC